MTFLSIIIAWVESLTNSVTTQKLTLLGTGLAVVGALQSTNEVDTSETSLPIRLLRVGTMVE